MGTRGKRLSAIDIGAGVYAAAFCAWMAVRTPGTRAAGLVGFWAFFPLGLVVAWACWRNSRLPGLDARTRLGWRLLLLAALALHISGSAWDLCLQLSLPERWADWADQLESLYPAFTIAAVLVFPSRSFDRASRTRFLIDVALVAGAGALLAFYFSLRLWFGPLQNEATRWMVLGPGLDYAVFFAVALGTLQKRDGVTRASLGFLLGSVMVYAGANYFFTLASYPASTYRPGDSVDGVWFAAWVLRWGAARWWWYRKTDSGAATARSLENRAVPYDSAGTAYLVISGSFVLLTSQVFADDRTFLPFLAIAAMAMVAVLLARQVVELRQNDRLFAAQVEQEARFRSLVDHSSDAVLVVDLAGTVSYASDTAARVFGDRSAVRAGVRLLDAIREDDRAILAPILKGGGGPRRVVLHVGAGASDWREIEAAWSDLSRDPAVSGIVLNCRDVTEQGDLERQLRHAQKLDAVGQLAGGLAHDINNALAVVRGYAELLADELEPGSPGASDLSHIEQAVDRAASITGKVLAFSRKQLAQPTVLDLSGLVGDLVPLLRQSVGSDVDVQLELEPCLWRIRADRGQMEQVLVNLATNARDAMPIGGRLTVTTSNLAVRSAADSRAGLPPGEYVLLVVRDEGVGISPDVRARIFEPFFSTKTATGGMGLGLAMVHDIVRASNGRIVVDSEPGRGAAFTVMLPRTDAPAAVEPSAAAAGDRDVRGKTVLVVDDEDNVRIVARKMLERAGYDVIEAFGGRQAIELLQDPAAHVDVLLTDVVMPGVSGRELIARTAVLRPALPVVCMTGFAGDSDDPGQFGENLVGLLSKPFSAEALKRIVATALAGRSGR